MEIPKNFEKNLKIALGSDFEEFIKLKDMPHNKGIRINTLKSDINIIQKLNLNLEQSPFCSEGFYVDNEGLGNHPLHHAGAFYVQEPSATSAVEMLDVKKGDYVLDLCAAPGGKSTQIAAKLGGTGLIWSNEIVFKRANILLSNFERMGVPNGIISSQKPDVLCEYLEGVFDKVLVDAPCSGEGMIRKDNSILGDWTKENVLACATRQQKILDSAAKALRAGGTMVYSTCTFSREENEENIEIFLKNHPEFSIVPTNAQFGREGYNLKETRRILWQDGGEGHFVAKLKKNGEDERREINYKGKTENANDILSQLGVKLPDGLIIKNGEKLYLTPDIDAPKNLGVIRQGIYLGEYAKNRFIPTHSMFSNKFIECENALDLKIEDPRTKAFLHGEEIAAENLEKGYCRIMIEGVPLSFGKFDGFKVKNHYPKGLRTLN